MLFVPAWYPSAANPLNGLFMRDLARALGAANDIVVLGPTDAVALPGDEDGLVRVLPAMPQAGGPAGHLARLRAFRAALAELRDEGRPADVVHAHVFIRGLLAALARPRGAERPPLVITENFSGFLAGTVSRLERRAAALAYRRADVVCPVSELQRRCLEHVEPRASYRVISEIVDVDAFARQTGARRAGHPGSSIVTVCHLTRRKGIHDLVSAVRLLVDRGRSVHLTIVGDGPERAALEAQAAGLPVSFRGGLPRQAVAEEILAADLFALPTLADPFAIAPVEALAAGIPVVVTDAAGCAELVAANGGAVVPPATPSALADAIELLLGESRVPADVAERLARSCGAASVARQYDAVYRTLVSDRTTR